MPEPVDGASPPVESEGEVRARVAAEFRANARMVRARGVARFALGLPLLAGQDDSDEPNIQVTAHDAADQRSLGEMVGTVLDAIAARVEVGGVG